MTLSALMLPAVRATVAAAALSGLTLTSGHALARNHDVQIIRILKTPLLTHDRAPSPVRG